MHAKSHMQFVRYVLAKPETHYQKQNAFLTSLLPRGLYYEAGFGVTSGITLGFQGYDSGSHRHCSLSFTPNLFEITDQFM